MNIPKECQDCVKEEGCVAECTGRLSEDEWLALSKYYVWKAEQNTFPENNLEDAIERWR